ncbi:MAG: DUF1015 domain-containing protein, partial [Planctomycetales bacterium]|nr:DUF1015 domain-containing protein [Planctomycetales bacterium]
MPKIQAFHGLRYDLGHVGNLSDVVAPPYDVIDGQLQKQLYERHPANVVRLILNREEPGDNDTNNRYSRAAKFLKNWRSEGLLKEDAQPCVYVYEQTFTHAGRSYTRHGFMSRVRLERFGEGKIYPHEETHSAAKADRLRLFQACKTNLSQVFGLFPDQHNDARSLLSDAIAGVTPLEATDHLGVVHRIWPVDNVNTITKLQAIMDPKPVFIADGHHRYETACNYRDDLTQQHTISADHPANFVLMMCVSMSDPGMIVLPTHRLFRGLAPVSSDDLQQRLHDHFTLRIAGEGADLAPTIWEEIETEDQQGTLGLYAAKDRRWVVARINDAGRRKVAELAPEHSADWHGLGVSILHRLIMDELLASSNLPKPMYVHSVHEVVDALHHGDTVGRDATGQLGQGGEFPLAALVMPATLDHIRAISQHGERMPAKSTYFYPKLLSG